MRCFTLYLPLFTCSEEPMFTLSRKRTYVNLKSLSLKGPPRAKRSPKRRFFGTLKGMKTLYLVRHGKSEANDERIYQRKETPLSKEGREQAYILQKRFEHIPIDILYSSSLKRAQETAEIINEKLKLSIHTTELVNEWGKPSSLLDISMDGEKSKEFRNELALHKDNLYWKWQDEESMGELRDRAVQFLEEMKKDSKDNILVVTHSLFLKVMLSVVLFGPEALLFGNIESFNAHTTNTGITVFQLQDGKENWKLITWNDYAHLGEL